MSNYSIKDLERITGIKAHTIRIWEKRYGVVNPMRTESNIRYYCDDDLRKLMNISILLRNGYKISRLAEFDPEELNSRIQEISIVHNGHENQIERMVIAMIELDEDKFEKILKSLIIKEGFENTIFHVIYPFFERIGVLWQTGTINPAQEHFISNLIKQKIYVAIDGVQGKVKENGKKFVLFLPEWEMHELGLLIYDYMIKSRGHHVVYLGQNVPFDDVIKVQEVHKPDFLFTSFINAVEHSKLKSYISELRKQSAAGTILITGHQVKNIDFELPSRVKVVEGADSLRNEVLSEI